jgi:hypothetical protein
LVVVSLSAVSPETRLTVWIITGFLGGNGTLPVADPTLAASNTTPPNSRVMARARRRLFFETFAFITGREVAAAFKTVQKKSFETK